MPWVEERCLFVRRMPDGSEFYFYGMMISSNVVRMSLYHNEIGWWHIVRWKYERGCLAPAGELVNMEPEQPEPEAQCLASLQADEGE